MTAKSTATPVDDSPMFAPIPSWERSVKRRGFGRARRPAEPRSFAPAALDETPQTVPAVDDAALVDSGFATAPVYASRSQARSSATTPVAIAAGLILIGGVAAAGWYYTQPHGQTGVAELTPGGATTTTSETTTTAQNTAPSDAAPPPAAVARTITTTPATRTASASRTHAPSPRSRAATDNSADVSATAPMPLPTPGVAPPPAAATAAPPAPLVLNIPPAAAAPQPVNPPTTTPQAAPQTSAPPPTEVPQA